MSGSFAPVGRGSGLVVLTIVILAACRGVPSTPTGPQLSGVATPSLAAADDPVLARCPSAEEIADLSLEIRFEDSISAGPRVCTAASGSADLSHRQLYIYVMLLTMQKLTFTRSLPWADQSLWDWFTTYRPRIAVMASGLAMCSPCAPAFPSLIIPVTRDTPITWENVVRLIGGFAHEARHIEAGGHPCGTRDRRVDDMGAFGVHNLVYQWIADHATDMVPATGREAARRFACEQRNSAFCNDSCAG